MKSLKFLSILLFTLYIFVGCQQSDLIFESSNNEKKVTLKINATESNVN